MFDDPRKNLHWMEQELLAEEEPEQPDEIYDTFGGEFQEPYGQYDDDALMDLVDELIEEEAPEPPVRNFANGYGRRRNPAVDFSRTVYADEEFDESAAVLVGEPPKKKEYNTYVKNCKKKKKKAKKKKGIKGLVFLAFLEILGILAIIGWWLQWLI